MKKITLLFTAIIAMTFISCSTEDTFADQEEAIAKSLLETYTLTRDHRGSYSLISTAVKGASSEFFVNEETNTNEVRFYNLNDVVNNSNRSSRQSINSLVLVNNKINLAFFENSSLTPSTLRIEDADFSNQRSTDSLRNFLTSYEVIKVGDGTYQFNFEVEDGVTVSYSFNEQESINEIHLIENGEGNVTNYSKSYNVSNGTELKIDFVQNHSSNRSTEETRRPRFRI